MNRITLNDFVKANNADLGAPFQQLLLVIEKTAKIINDKLSRNGLIEEQGSSGDTNVYGEDVQKLDEYANKVFTDALLACPAVAGVGSEELAEPKISGHDGLYLITHDPLDGSSNIDTNLPIGTIFGVYPQNTSVLQKGNTLFASGYILYGPSMMLVYATTAGKVNGFTYDFQTNEFILSHPDIKIGEKKIYSINEGNWELFSESDKNYLTAIKKEGGYSLRYVGSMVADIHRTLLKGGIFLYPADSKHPEGKLRLLYEVAPLSFLIIQAGGDGVSRGVNPLDIMPSKHDQRVPIALGSKVEIEKYSSFQKSNPILDTFKVI
ncbi:fructose-1,6-bisphosphatase [Candidatus Gottesmanbacteria bacterium]|nr:fructose-1,6-bisphosphatase [Candidatus Gottesmanbacteria bacterium]